MSNIANVRSLGKTFTVRQMGLDMDDIHESKVQLVSSEQILSSALGEYDRETHGSYAKYMKNSVKKLPSNKDVDYSRVMWHINRNPEGVVISDLVKDAFINGYDTVIIEDLSE